DTLGSVLADRAGRIWFGRASGVYVLKPESPDELARLDNLTVRQLGDSAQPRPAGDISLPEQAGEIFKYVNVRGFGASDTTYLYETSDGHIWISAGDGVVEFDGRTFIPHTTAQGLLKGYG